MKINAAHILTEPWLIQKDIISSLLPVFINYLNGKTSGTFEKEDPKFFCVNRNLTDRYELQYNGDNIPNDTILIIDLRGPLFTFEYEMFTRALQLAAVNNNIISSLILANTPGGMIRGIESFTNEILNFPKPINAHVNFAASAGEWIISGCDYISLEGELSEMGSIGVFSSWMDIKKMYKLQYDLDIIDYYATKSVRKNEEIRQIEDSEGKDASLLISKMDFINDSFHNFVAKNRKIDLSSEVFQGAMYYAQDAIKLKLGDSIMSFAQAVEKAYTDGLKNTLTPKHPNPKLNRI